MIQRASLAREPDLQREVEVEGEVVIHIKPKAEISMESVLVNLLNFRKPNKGLEEEGRETSLLTTKIIG